VLISVAIKEDDFIEQMTQNNSFSWYDEITETIHNEIPPNHDHRLYIPPTYIVISTVKIVQAIEKYGVNTKDRHGLMILDLKSINSNRQYIDIIMRYKPNLVINGFIFYPCGDAFYIIKTILEYDVDYIYNRYPYRHGRVVYDNLLEYKKLEEKQTIMLHDEDGHDCYDHCFHKEFEFVTMLHNHMMKGTTLFEKMLKLTDLVQTNKRRRFH